MKYKIDRAILAHGGTTNSQILGTTHLLSGEGKMCCLGQVCLQEGVPKDILLLNSFPRAVGNSLPEGYWLLAKNDHGTLVDSSMALAMMSVNDNPRTTREQKEARLIELAASAGHEFEFVGEYPAGVI